MIPNNINQEFIISDYFQLLGDKCKSGKYKCPNCNKVKLSINNDGKKYTCFGCNDSNSIAYILRQKNGEFINRKEKYDNTYYQNKNSDNKDSKGKLIKLIKDIKRLYPDIRFNEHDGDIWINNNLFSKNICEPELLHIHLAKYHGLEYPKEKVIDSLLSLAKENTFNPLIDYLDNCRTNFLSQHDNNVTEAIEEADNILSKVSKNYLGTSDHLYDVYLRNWLLSAVGRAYYPACYTRSVLILQGKQNIGKSTFFSLLGGDWFSDSLMEAKNKDELMIAHSNWILEWQELETIWGMKTIGRVKAFISAKEDALRLPYARKVSKVKRRFVLCGTTNQNEFLTDKTGNSRFWVIPCENINLVQWEKDRKIILGALALLIHYNHAINPESIKNGQLWGLTKEEAEISDQHTKTFEEVHPFEEIIDEIINIWDDDEAGAGWILANKIWEELDIPVKERQKYLYKIGQIMNNKGYKNTNRKIEGKSKRIWIRK